MPSVKKIRQNLPSRVLSPVGAFDCAEHKYSAHGKDVRRNACWVRGWRALADMKSYLWTNSAHEPLLQPSKIRSISCACAVQHIAALQASCHIFEIFSTCFNLLRFREFSNPEDACLLKLLRSVVFVGLCGMSAGIGFWFWIFIILVAFFWGWAAKHFYYLRSSRICLLFAGLWDLMFSCCAGTDCVCG